MVFRRVGVGTPRQRDLCEGATRQLDTLTVSTIATLQRRGTFTERGYTTTTGVLGDLLGWERFEARRVVAAEQICPRIGLDGTTLPPRLPATAQVFAAGQAGLRHVEAVAKVGSTTPQSSTPSPPSSTPEPSPSPPTTTAQRPNGRPKPSPRSADTSSTTARATCSPSAAGAARTSM